MERKQRRRRDEELRGWGYFCHSVCASVVPHLMILATVISNICKDGTYVGSASLTYIWNRRSSVVLAVQDMTSSLEKYISLQQRWTREK